MSASEQRFDVVVALVGGGFDDEFFDKDCARPYSDRDKVVISADGSDSLATVLGKAAQAFQPKHPGDYRSAGLSLDFYRGDPAEHVYPTLPTTQTVTITDDSGLAAWHVAPGDASIRDLVVACERKVFRGDPLRPYLLVDPRWQMGGGTPGGWDNFIDIWEALILGAGSWQVLKGMYAIPKTTFEFLERVAKRWRDHRAASLYVRELFESREADIMDVIGTSQAMATYQLKDLMAWTGIHDPAVAACVAGWAGLDVDDNGLASPMDDIDADIVSYLPTSLSMQWFLVDNDGAAHKLAMEELGRRLVEHDLAQQLESVDQQTDPPVWTD